MRSPQSHARSTPGWPPTSIGPFVTGPVGQVSPWSSSVPSLVPLTYASRPSVVGAANAHILRSAAARSMNWSTSRSTLPGDPLPSHRSEAWIPPHPFGSVTVYPYVCDVNVLRSADGDGDGARDVTLAGPDEQATRTITARIGARAAMVI